MSVNNNTEVSKKIRNGLKLQQAVESIPTRVGDVILPVFVSNPDRLIRLATGTAANATSGAVLTTSTKKDTFIVGVQLTLAKDVVNDGFGSGVDANLFGRGTTAIIYRRYQSLNASELFESVNFDIPLKLERGSNIVVTNSHATAAITTTATIFYYETDGEE